LEKEPMMATELRARLDREASRVHAPSDAMDAVLERVGRKVHRRRRTARVLGLAIALALIGGSLAVLRAGALRDVGNDDGSWAGIWPQASHADALAAQNAADAGDPSATWQVDGVLVLKRFASERFGWEAPRLQRIANAAEVSEPGAPIDDPAELSDPNSTGPLRVLVVGCAPDSENMTCPAAYITAQRLIRDGPTGIWGVTAYEFTTRGFASPSPSPVG
jgi:hypothetical protein